MLKLEFQRIRGRGSSGCGYGRLVPVFISPEECGSNYPGNHVTTPPQSEIPCRERPAGKGTLRIIYYL